jgi:hypothetical protein
VRAATARAVERDAVTGGEILWSYRPLLFLSVFFVLVAFVVFFVDLVRCCV